MTTTDPLSDEYRHGWCEGASAVLVALIGRELGGFLQAPDARPGKDGAVEEWIAVGDIFAVISEIQKAPMPPKAKACHD